MTQQHSMHLPDQGFILAAGFGKRMGELTADLPKPLLPVNGRPLIDYTLFLFWQLGIREVVINVHYLAEKIVTHLESFTAMKIRFSIEPEILGTAGGLRTGLKHFSHPDGPFLLANPDVLLLPDYPRLRSMLIQLHTRLASHNDRPDFGHALFLQSKPAGSSEKGFNFNSPLQPNVDGSMQSNNVTGSLTLEPTAGEYIYIGLGLLHGEPLLDLPIGEYAELAPVWSDLSSHRMLFGGLFPGTLLDAGTATQYLSIRDLDPISQSAQDEWQKFIALWNSPYTL